MTSLLKVQKLRTCIRTEHSTITVVDDVSFELNAGETLGLVGESGSGKSMTALSIMGLLPQPDCHVAGGKVCLENEQEALVRGRDYSMIFQDPMTALNPVQKIGKQIEEVLLLHRQFEPSSPGLKARVLTLLQDVGLDQPEQRYFSYPHQLSGGMRQRVMIAIALACNPRLLIADEPTTALDVTVQSQIISLLKSLQTRYGMAMLFITHDLALISQLSDRVAVMYAGQIVELTSSRELFANPKHPYTRALLASSPALHTKRKERLPSIPGLVMRPEAFSSACRFAARCNHATQACLTDANDMDDTLPDHQVRCLRWRELA